MLDEVRALPAGGLEGTPQGARDSTVELTGESDDLVTSLTEKLNASKAELKKAQVREMRRGRGGNC